jgi:hypothetical protein
VSDGIDRTHCFAQCAGYTFLRVDIKHLVTFMNAVDRTYVDAGTILDTNTRRHDDKRQLTPLPVRRPFLTECERAFISILRLKGRY